MFSQMRIQISLRTLLLVVFVFSALAAIGVRRHQALTRYKDDCLEILLMQPNNPHRMPSINVITRTGDMDVGQYGRCIKHGNSVWIEITAAKPAFPLYSYTGIVICNRLDDDHSLSKGEYNQIADQYREMARFNIP